MTAQQGAPAPAQSPPAPAQPAPGDTETGRIKTIEELSARQDAMDGKLDKILAHFGGGGAPAASPPKPASPPASDPATVTEQMKAAVRAVHAEEREAAKGTQPPAAPAPEHTPREVAVPFKTRLQAAVFGKNPA